MSSAAAPTASLSHSLRLGLGVSWPLLLGVAAFLLPVLMGYGLGDGDTYLHIASGRWMLTHGAVLTQDRFSFTRLGAPSTAQEWGSDLLIATAFRVAEWPGLLLLAAVCFGATVAYVMRWLQARMEPLHAVLLTLLAASMMLPSLFARPHALVWPVTVVWVGTLVGCCDEDRAPPWWLLGVMLLWVNMHGSFIIGPALALALAADSILNAQEGRWRIAKRWSPFVLAASACMLVNPQGQQLAMFPFHLIGQKAALAMVVEWQPPNFQHPQVLGVWLVAVVVLALLGRIRLSLVRSVVLVGLLYMALQHVRNVALLGLISPFLLARPISTLWRQSPLPGRDANAMDRLFHALASPARHSATWMMLVLAGITAVIALSARDLGPPASVRPRAALNALRLELKWRAILPRAWIELHLEHFRGQFAAGDDQWPPAEYITGIMASIEQRARALLRDRDMNGRIEELDDGVTHGDGVRHQGRVSHEAGKPLGNVRLAGPRLAVHEDGFAGIECGPQPVEHLGVEHYVPKCTAHQLARYQAIVYRLLADHLCVCIQGHGCVAHVAAARQRLLGARAASLRQRIPQARFVETRAADLQAAIPPQERERFLEDRSRKGAAADEGRQSQDSGLVEVLLQQLADLIQAQSRIDDRLRTGCQPGGLQLRDIRLICLSCSANHRGTPTIAPCRCRVRLRGRMETGFSTHLPQAR